MAKDNDKGLYLPLKIDLKEWEKELATADADLQKAMREMRSAVSDLKLRYDVKIEGAKAAGNQMRVLELQTAKLNQLYDIQKTKVAGLTQAYDQLVKAEGATSQNAQKLATTLAREQKEMYRLQGEINKLGQGMGAQISQALADISPAFARAREAVNNVTGSLGKMSAASTAGVAAITAIGGALTAATLAAKGLEKITTHVNEIAEAGRQASDPIYQLRESLQSSYEDAEYLYGVTKIDGSNAESLANALVRLDNALKKDTEGTSLAARTLKRYGAELVDANGNVKTYKEQLQELAKAAQTAAQAGEFREFKAGMKGAFATTEFDHLLLGLEGYEAKSVQAIATTKLLYGELHSVGDESNRVAAAQERLNAQLGGLFAGASAKNLREQSDTLIAVGNVMDKNGEKYKKTAEDIGQITNAWTELKGVATIALENIKADMVGQMQDAKKYADTIGKAIQASILALPGGVGIAIMGAWNLAKPYFQKAEQEVKAEINKVKEATAQAEQEAEKKSKQSKGTPTAVETPEQTKAREARKAMEERLSKEIRDLRATEYEKELNALNDKLQAYRDEGADEVKLAELYAVQKAKIDERYTAKAKQELDKQSKATAEAYKKQTEEAKKAREAAINDAANTMRQNLKILRYAEKQRQAGNENWQADTRAYAERQYMKQNGLRASDFTALQNIGVGVLKQLADAQTRLFAQFAPGGTANQGAESITNNNTTTVNIDRPILTDEAMINALTSKVLDNIVPAIERTISNATGNQLGTTGG